MALEDLSEAIKIMPNDPEARERRAYVEMQVRDYDKALADYSEAIKQRPNEARYYSYRAHILADKGDLKNALADTEKVLKIDKKNANAQALKTWIETQLKNQSQLGPAPATTP